MLNAHVAMLHIFNFIGRFFFYIYTFLLIALHNFCVFEKIIRYYTNQVDSINTILFLYLFILKKNK